MLLFFDSCFGAFESSGLLSALGVFGSTTSLGSKEKETSFPGSKVSSLGEGSGLCSFGRLSLDSLLTSSFDLSADSALRGAFFATFLVARLGAGFLLVSGASATGGLLWVGVSSSDIIKCQSNNGLTIWNLFKKAGCRI